MSANTDTVIQINYKTPGGALINLYANSPEQFDQVVDFLASRIDKIASVESVLNGASAVAQQIPVTPVVQAPPVQPPAQQWAPVDPGPPPAAAWGPPTAAPQAGGVIQPVCLHGARVIRNGTSGKGPWVAAFCPTEKGTPNQCEPIFFKQGSAEWNAFKS